MILSLKKGLEVKGVASASTEDDTSPTGRDWQIFRREVGAGVPSSLPFARFLDVAIMHNLFSLIDGGAHLTPLWELVRAVKSHPDAAGRSPCDLLSMVETVFKTWISASDGRYRLHPPESRPRDVDDVWMEEFHRVHFEAGVEAVLSAEAARAEFLHIVRVSYYALGDTPIRGALSQAAVCPLEFPNDLDGTEGYKRFLSFAGWFQVMRGDRTIYLPCERLGQELEVDSKTVWRYREMAMDDGLLTHVEAHKFRGKGRRGRAAGYRFDLSRFSGLAEAWSEICGGDDSESIDNQQHWPSRLPDK